MSKPKYTTYAITHRPRNGITDSDISLFTTWVSKHCEYYFVITEGTDNERHIHSAIVLRVPITRSNLTIVIGRLFKNLDPEEKSVLNKGIKIMYSDSFINHYMTKDEDAVVVMKNLPESGSLDSFYPVQSEKVEPSLMHHAEMKRLERLWRESRMPFVEVNTSVVRDFLFDMMYNERKIGLMDDKRLFQTARHFTRWMNKVDVCRLELPPFEKEEGPGLH